MKETEIEYNLSTYVQRIEKDIELGNFRTTKTEDFFLRVLSLAYNLDNLENLAYDKINTIAIDLIDRKKEIGVQVTAQKSNEKKKIDDTIDDTISVWKNQGVKTLWILFISETPYIKKNIDTSNLYIEKDGIKVYIKTTRRLIGDINKHHFEERLKIDEILKQEVSTEYHGLSRLSLFNEISKGQKIVNDNFFNLESTIYYSKTEYKTINYLANQFSNGKLKEYCILGNPCSGKTTFAYSIIQKISIRKTFYLNLGNPSINSKYLTDELIQISHNYSFVIIDNIHDNIELFHYLRNRISHHKWINVLYLSRYYKTFDDFDTENIYKLIDGIPFFKIDTNENFEEKVSGIIWKKTKLLIDNGSSLQWKKGNFKQVLKNINRNLLKLNIALRMWEQKNSQSSPLSFDKIDSNKILQQFFLEHKLNLLKSDALLTYCLLFKNDIAFVPLRNAYDENSILREKGIILQYFKSDFCFFPHKEYAQLIFDAFNYIENGISKKKKVELIIDYVHRFDLNENELRLNYLLTKFHFSDDNDIIDYLLADESFKNKLISEINDSGSKFSLIIRILDIIFLHSKDLDKKILRDYYDSFIAYFRSNKLSLYIEKHYLAYSRLIQLSDFLKAELNDNLISVVLRENEKATTDSIVELTLRISKKNREAETILRILHSYEFPDWLKMITSLPRLTNITNSLSELNSSIESKSLLIGLMRNIDWDKQYTKAKSLKIDQYVKSLREIQLIDISLGTNVSNDLFYKAYNDFFFKEKFAEANLSEYSKAYTDLSKINLPFVKNELLKDLKSNILFEKFSTEKKISNFTMRAQQLKKYFDNSLPFIETLNSIVTSEMFYSILRNEKNLNHLLIFSEFAEKYLNYEGSQLKQILSDSITRIVNKLPNKLEALSNPKLLNVDSLDSSFVDSISGKDIEKYFKSNKITYAEDLFRVLSAIDKDKTISKFEVINNRVIIDSLLNPELNFSQALEDLYKLRNKVYKNENKNCNQKICIILRGYLNGYTSDKRRYDRVNISDFFKGYYYGLTIDTKIIESYCENDFLKKLKSNSHKSFEISPLFQFLRRISELFKGEMDNMLLRFLENNTENIIEVIKREDITKTLSGLSELALTKFDIYGDDLLYKTRKTIIYKVGQRKKEDIYKVKLIPDLEKIAKDKGKIVLRELKK